MQRLLKSGELAGSLRGREYMPVAFSRTQRACIDAFFAQNGYVEVARAQKLKVGVGLPACQPVLPCLSALH